MGHKQLSTEDIMKLLEGHKPIFDEKKVPELSTGIPCPSCKSTSSYTAVDKRNPFTPGSLTANRVGVCGACNTEFNLRTGLQIKP